MVVPSVVDCATKLERTRDARCRSHRAEGQLAAPIVATTNMLSGDLVVSRSFINPLGFQPGISSPTNVSYVYGNGQPLNPADFLQNLTNLLIDPRVPVFIRTNRPPAAPVSEFRFYIDLNRNGRFDTNGFFLPYQSTIYLALYYGMNETFEHRQVRPVAWAYAVAVLVGIAVSLPLWHALGLVG